MSRLAEIGAFAGVQAGGNISGAIEWFDPHLKGDGNIAHDSNKQIVNKEKKFTAIAKLSQRCNCSRLGLVDLPFFT